MPGCNPKLSTLRVASRMPSREIKRLAQRAYLGRVSLKVVTYNVFNWCWALTTGSGRIALSYPRMNSSSLKFGRAGVEVVERK